MKNMIIAVDFDGTCVTHEFPKVGREIGAAPVLKRLVAEGAKLILWTMRSDNRPATHARNGEPMENPNPLTDAVAWFEGHEIPLFGIQRNPTQDSWTSSPKAYAKLYIDDAALGCPLKQGLKDERPYVDWDAVEKMLFPETHKEKPPSPDELKAFRNEPFQEGDFAVECSNPGVFLKVHPSEFGKNANHPAYSYFRRKQP